MSNDQATSSGLGQVTRNPKRSPPRRPTEKTPCPQCGKLGAWAKSKWNLEEHMKRDVCFLNRRPPGPSSSFTEIERPDPKEGSHQGLEQGVIDGRDTIPSPVPYQQSFTSELPHGASVQPEGLSALYIDGLSNSNSHYSQSEIDLQESTTVVPSRKRSRQNGEDDADLIINSGDEGYSGFQDVGRGEIGQFAGNVTSEVMEALMTGQSSNPLGLNVNSLQQQTNIYASSVGEDGAGQVRANADGESYGGHHHHHQQQQSYISQPPQLLPSPQSELPPSVELVVRLTAVAMKAVLEQSSQEFATPFELAEKAALTAVKAGLEGLGYRFRRQ